MLNTKEYNDYQRDEDEIAEGISIDIKKKKRI